ncbi:VWA domain-containing protein [Endozoicomonas gorgoniicola]|uniref:VWA domain-containing protein n=1 Tax=Endozoicomonas gorgoniicola TaxID=1234144 RepID=A0ABT3MTB9_9GAMM|nr:VWA domain-containing protein [Endozoicomonas gorgoniicola]MCW7552636.1 VWA domain-containing protein [Endozoicomonas gorgoniicola]
MKDNIAASDSLNSELKSWELDTKLKLAENFPFSRSETQCSEAEAQFELHPDSASAYKNNLVDFEAFLKDAKLPRDISYWQKAVAYPTSVVALRGNNLKQVDVRLQRKLLLQEWRKRLRLKRSEWELDAVNRYRAQFLKQIDEWLENLKKIVNYLEELGLEPGYFLDLSRGGLSLTDIEQIRHWAKYLSEDKGVKELCELLGKVRQISLSEKVEMAKTVVSVPVTIPDVNSREEIIGIKLGKDIEHLLPSELALLSDSDTAMLFDLKYIESRLMCFDMQGMQSHNKEVEIEEEQQVNEEEKMGPIVICVDTSGSMHGSPETIAKAVTLYMATVANQNKRACYLINFSTAIETLDLSAGYNLQTLLAFLQKSFHGGTDVEPAISHGLGIMESDEYRNADMLIISDFVMSSLSSEMLETIEKQRLDGNRFYSLCIGNEFMSNRLRSHFDREWIYNPSSSTIRELIGFQTGLLDR